MRVILLIVASAITFSAAVGQQQSARDVYPTLTTYKKNGKDPGLDLTFNGCVDGNCLSGEGTYLVQYISGSKFESDKDEAVETQVLLYKGSFSDNGKLFSGRSYKVHVTYKGNSPENSNRFTPQNNYNFSRPGNWSDSLIAEGGGIYVIPAVYGHLRTFQHHGYVKDYVRQKWSAGFQTYEGVYNKGVPEKVIISYTPNDLIKRYAGSIAYSGDFILGRAEYTDGSFYEGGFFENKFYGPGVYTGTDGKKFEGIWEKGVLTTKKTIRLPAHLFSLKAGEAARGTPTSLSFAEEMLPAFFANSTDTRTTEPAFVTVKEGFYYGTLKDGKPNGDGFFYRSQNSSESDRYKDIKNETVFLGTFTDGWLSSGSINNMTIELTARTGPYRKKGSFIRRGTFVKHELEGCGVLDGSPYIQGFFKNGYPAGWAYVSGGTKRLPAGLQYVAYGQFETIFDMHFYEKEGNAEAVYQKVATDTVSCAGTHDEKLAYLKLIEKKIEEFKLENKKKKMAAASKAYADSLCTVRQANVRFKNNTVVEKGGREAVVTHFDCTKNVYQISWVANDHPYSGGWANIPAADMASFTKAGHEYRECAKCRGAGGEHVEYDVTTTKEVPFGYFSGIKTTITKTVREKSYNRCNQCNGKGYIKGKQS